MTRFGWAMLAALAAAPVAVRAQTATGPGGHGAMPGMTGGAAMTDAMTAMNQAMAAAPMTGDPDHDFAAMMIPHHQGAIDMAQAELRNGKDPSMRRLATAIITAQRDEIAAMRRFLSRQQRR